MLTCRPLAARVIRAPTTIHRTSTSRRGRVDSSRCSKRSKSRKSSNGELGASPREALGRPVKVREARRLPLSQYNGTADGTGLLELTDPIFILSFLFRNGPQPKVPFLGCGEDPTPDELTCISFGMCE